MQFFLLFLHKLFTLCGQWSVQIPYQLIRGEDIKSIKLTKWHTLRKKDMTSRSLPR